MNIIIFSKDRACQLDLLLRSFSKYFKEFEDNEMKIIYKFSNNKFKEGYEKLYSKYKNILFIKEENFKNDVIKSISLNEYFTMFLVDDIVFKNHLSLKDKEFNLLKEDNNILCISLRLSKFSNYCFALDRQMNLPNSFSENQWFWREGFADFGYPMSLDGSIFRTSEIFPIINSIIFNGPNQLEGEMSTKSLMNPKILCYDDSILVNNACNKTQNVIGNRSGNINLKEINDKFLNGYIINMEDFNLKNNNSCHINIDLNFIKNNDD